MASTTGARPYQVVIWGASGFTGRLVAKHLALSYQGKVRWALAGRDSKKLEEVRTDLIKINPDCKDIPILVAKPDDGVSVGKVLSQTQVVIATAGPFAKYGNTVVEQSIEQGTHYCDITGEVQWVKQNIQRYNQKAKDKGVRVVSCCGYDSIPSDLGTFMMVEALKKKGKKTGHVYHLIEDIKSSASGGTIASVQNLMKTVPASELAKIGSDAYYLAEAATGKRGEARVSPVVPTFIAPAGVWSGPFFMEGVNGRIVHLSNALCSYGNSFQYTEMFSTGRGWFGWAGAIATTASLALVGAVMLPPLSWVAQYVLPKPGQGPSEQLQVQGRWRHSLVAVSEEEQPGATPTIIRGTIGDSRDAGYWSTSRMVLEAALCMALEGDKLKAAGLPQGGCLSPAAAMGAALIDRLRAAGFVWKVEEEAAQKAQ